MPKRKTDIYKTLKEEHGKVKKMLKGILSEKDGSGMEALNGIISDVKKELEAHMGKEEKYFYSALEEDDDARKLIFEAYEEHNIVKNLLNNFDGTGAMEDRDQWMARVKVLDDMVLHHIKEEEGEVFKEAKKFLEKDQEERIGQEFENDRGFGETEKRSEEQSGRTEDK